MHATIFLGGPVPTFDGQLRVHSLSVGTNHGATPMTWQEYDPVFFNIMKTKFGEYLETAFSTYNTLIIALSF